MSAPEESGAALSACQLYRYRLWRVWSYDEDRCVFVMLNPSTADAAEDDPTIRRCRNYAKAWGYGGFEVVNLFAYRTPSPKVLWRAERDGVDIVGRRNDTVLEHVLQTNSKVVAAWGAQHRACERAHAFRVQARELGCDLFAIALTAAGAPRHPLYLRRDLEPQRYV